MKKVLLKFYDKKNLGDDLFIKILSDRYKNTLSVVLSNHHPYVEGLKQVSIYRNKLLFLFYKAIEKLFRVRHIWLRKLAKHHDLLISVGGSIFIENHNLKQWRRERQFYQNLSIPYYILGSNFGPHQSAEFIEVVSDILHKAQDVCFRDQASYELFHDLPSTRVATDMVFALKTANYEIKNEKIAIFSLINCANRFDKHISSKYEKEIINMTRQLVASGYRVIYMSFCQFEGDEVAIINIKKQMDSNLIKHVAEFHYHGQLEEALSLLARCEIIVATRFHAAILGLLFSKKMLPLAYDKKTINMLSDLGFDGEVVNLHHMHDFDGSQFNFESLKINKIDQQIALAEQQFQELDKLLLKASS